MYLNKGVKSVWVFLCQSFKVCLNAACKNVIVIVIDDSVIVIVIVID